MIVKIDNRRILISGLGVTFFFCVAFVLNWALLQIILGVPLLLFFPGWVLLSVFFPGKEGLGTVERVCLSSGLSIVVTTILGLILHCTVFGIRVYPVLILFTIYISVMIAVAWYRETRLPSDKRYAINIDVRIPYWLRQSTLDKCLVALTIIALLIAAGCIGYVFVNPKADIEYTEFYVLGPEGKAYGYPEAVYLGDDIFLQLGIVNHEGRTVDYVIEVMIDGIQDQRIPVVQLGDGEKWESKATVASRSSGGSQSIEIWLYEEGKGIPYYDDPLHINVDVLTSR